MKSLVLIDSVINNKTYTFDERWVFSIFISLSIDILKPFYRFLVDIYMYIYIYIEMMRIKQET